MHNKLKSKIASLPDSPGVYLFKDAKGKIIYIGKAKSLKKRVQTYFSCPLDTKTQVMVSKIADLEHRLSPSEAQAQILEAALIKEKQPQYNITLKDDKSFPWIKISDEEFPVVSIARRKKKLKNDTALYFGPYTDAKLLRQALKIMRRIFGFRSCRKIPKQACLYWRIKLCPAPCIGKISPGEYKKIVERIKLFLDSKNEELTDRLASEMKALARDKRFEEAAELRDRISALSAITQEDNVSSATDELEDLKHILGLEKLPLGIEAFDISNISGQEATGSMVSFYKGQPDKNNYRRFRIKTVAGIDDYDMLREVVCRRYSRVIKENLPLPDLVLIDGGKGQLAVAQDEIARLGLKLNIASIAKEKENIYVAGSKRAIKLKQDTPALNLLRRLRDEAHRFALKYHHLLHKKKIIGK